MHLDDDLLQRLIDGELATREALDVRGHLDGCGACRARVRDAEQDVKGLHALLASLDQPSTPVPLERVIAAARAPGARAAPIGGSRLRWAAGVAIGLGVAGAAYALPGSPLPAWLDARLRSGPPSAASEEAVTPGMASGISMAPGAGVVVELLAAGSPPEVVVVLSDARELTVRARGGPAAFRSDPGRLRAVARGPEVAFDVEIPRDAPAVELIRDGTTIFVKRGDAIRTTATPDASGRYRYGVPDPPP